MRCQLRPTVEAGVYRCQRWRCRRVLRVPATVAVARLKVTCQAAPWAGVGDTFAALIHLVTLGHVTPCAACGARRAWLNAHLPYPLKGSHLWALMRLAIKRLRGAICRLST